MERVLKLLDRWYRDKIEKSFTKEVEEKFISCFYKALEDEPELKRMYQLYGMERMLRKDVQLSMAEGCFFRIYGLEGLCANLNMSKGVKEEYVEPILERLRAINLFVEEVAKESEKRSLSFEDIDNIAKGIFREGLSKLWLSWLDATLIFLSFLGVWGVFPFAKMEVFLRITESLRPCFSYILEKVWESQKYAPEECDRCTERERTRA